MDNVILHEGDCLDVMRGMDANSVDTIVTDPPYGLEFMGKDWDKLWNDKPYGKDNKRPTDDDGNSTGLSRWNIRRPQYRAGTAAQQWHEAWAVEALRVAKPGAMLFAFGGTRTHHRLMCAIEDAGWVIRDVILWIYGSGFPKSHSIGKAIDRKLGAIRKKDKPVAITGYIRNKVMHGQQKSHHQVTKYNEGQRVDYVSSAPAAAEWDGWGTALKPAYEPIILAMKPLDGTFAQNALKWGVAGLWIDGARVPGENWGSRPKYRLTSKGAKGGAWANQEAPKMEKLPGQTVDPGKGRWPANLIHDGSEEATAGFPVTSVSGSAKKGVPHRGISNKGFLSGKERLDTLSPNDSGSAARYFYCAKASRRERNAGLEEMEKKRGGGMKGTHDETLLTGSGNKRNPFAQNFHPTVKPLALMRYLCKLSSTPSGGVVLDPFMGSGSTGCAAVLENRRFIGIDKEAQYLEIATRRIAHAENEAKVQQPELGL